MAKILVQKHKSNTSIYFINLEFSISNFIKAFSRINTTFVVYTPMSARDIKAMVRI